MVPSPDASGETPEQYLDAINVHNGRLLRFLCPAAAFLFVADAVLPPVFRLALNGVQALLFTVFSPAANLSSTGRAGALFCFWIAAASAILANRRFRNAVLGEMITRRRLEIEREMFRAENTKDGLTGLSGKRDYESVVQYFISVCRHVHQTLCAIMIDIDYFRKYNDRHGHEKGDAALRALAGALKRLQQEEMVFAARVGGEEFIVLWTENRIAEAERIAIKLDHLVRELAIPYAESGLSPWLTVSQGIYVMRGGSQDRADDLYHGAEEVLALAKSAGRNRIMLRDSADGLVRRVEILPPEKNTGRGERQDAR